MGLFCNFVANLKNLPKGNTLLMKQILFKIKSFVNSFSFLKGILKTIAIILPIVVGWLLGYLSAGVSIGLSILVISPSDIPGNRTHHIGGLLMATFLAMFSSFLVNITQFHLYLLLPTIFVLTFFNAYISLYGFRASMVAISGLFSIATTLAHLRTGEAIYINLGYIFLGGLWFIAVVLFYLWLKPRQYSEQLLGKCFALTADFFTIRADLLVSEDREEGIKKMIDLQTELNDNYEKLREVILDRRSRSGRTNYLQRQLLMFMELVDIFELALANPIPYDKIDDDFKNHKGYLQPYVVFLQELSMQLWQMSIYIGSRKSVKLNGSLTQQLEKVKNTVDEFKTKIVTDTYGRKELLTLRNLYQYIENQYKTIENIRLIFENYYKETKMQRDEKTYRKFVSIQNYSYKRLRDHFSLASTFFRHALRLSITITIGYLIGILFSINNAYWIIFTIFIIMRPGFGLTKQRSLKRISGTVIGGILAFSIIYLFPDKMLYGVLGVICMPMAFALIQQNYTTATTFVTLSVVFLYASFTPDVYAVIQYRILDTAIGVTLAIVANYTILPYWEYRNYDEAVEKSIQANINYLKQVKILFNSEKSVTNTYKISRKEAFLRLSNLNAVFQRMMQDPKSKRKDASVYEITVIQQSFLASVASMGVRMKTNKNTFPKAIFNTAIDNLIKSLNATLLLLNTDEQPKLPSVEKPLQELNNAVKELLEEKENPTHEKAENQDPISLREVHLYSEQFNYLYGLVENLQEGVGLYVREKQSNNAINSALYKK